MTRKDYNLIAQSIRDTAAGYSSAIARQILCRDLAGRLAGSLEADNPRFDRERFLRACGVES